MSVSQPISSNHVAPFSINWMKAKIIWFVLSFLLLSCSIFAIYTFKFNTTIDFKGGTLIEAGFKTLPDIPKMRKILDNSQFKNTNVQQFGETEIVINVAAHETLSANDIATKIKSILSESYKDDISFRRVETVGPKVGNELIETSAIAIFISIIAMLVYIWIRFELPFAIGAVIALMHDVIITLGCLSFFQIEFGLPIIAALLTIVGYSMNDTVVIYDRIRENLVKFKRASKTEIINLSINEVFTRTLVTSGTTLIALCALLIFGGSILRPFILTMTLGVIIGTYSSVFVASPFLLFLNIKNNFKANKKSKKSKASSVGIL
ncbi:MAG: preprotein translocase SecF subunit [Alphaproteobacteria bacterium]|jgi:preprotein translocase SecF subunit